MKKGGSKFVEFAGEVEDVMSHFFMKAKDLQGHQDFKDLENAVNNLQKEQDKFTDEEMLDLKDSNVDYSTPIHKKDNRETKRKKANFQALKGAAYNAKDQLYRSLTASVGIYLVQVKESKIELVTRVIISLKMFKSVDKTNVKWNKFFDEYFAHWSRVHDSIIYTYRTYRSLVAYLEREGLMKDLQKHVDHMILIYTHHGLGPYEFPDDFEGLKADEIKTLRNAALPQVLALINNSNATNLRRDKIWFKLLILCVVRHPYAQKVIAGEVDLEDGVDSSWKEGDLFDDRTGNYSQAMSTLYDKDNIDDTIVNFAKEHGVLKALGNYSVEVANWGYTKNEKIVNTAVEKLKSASGNPDIVGSRRSSRKSKKTKYDEDDEKVKIGKKGIFKVFLNTVILIFCIF
jgi:hypothetical protein